MAQCQDSSYEIRKTDENENSIVVLRKQIDDESLDITLIGRRREEYGEVFNENLLFLLENFASPEDESDPGNPDPTKTTKNVLSNPTAGQFWYNSTNNRIYHFTGLTWEPLGQIGDVAGNSGTIADGEQIPRPVSTLTGYVFPYEECSWVVAPSSYGDNISYMSCYTDTQGNVTFKFNEVGSGTLTSGVANYQIIGIRGNNNLGSQTTPVLISPTPTPSITSSPVVDPTPTPTSTQTPTSGDVTPTPTSTQTPTSTPTPTPSRSQGATPQPTPSPTSTQTPTSTSTPTPTPTSTQTPTPSESLPALETTTSSSSTNQFNTSCFSGTGDVTIPSLNHQFSVSGGSGSYTITQDGACTYEPGSSLCGDITINITSTGASIDYGGTVYTQCPGASGTHRAYVDFIITDDVTGVTINETLFVQWEVTV